MFVYYFDCLNYKVLTWQVRTFFYCSVRVQDKNFKEMVLYEKKISKYCIDFCNDF